MSRLNMFIPKIHTTLQPTLPVLGTHTLLTDTRVMSYPENGRGVPEGQVRQAHVGQGAWGSIHE